MTSVLPPTHPVRPHRLRPAWTIATSLLCTTLASAQPAAPVSPSASAAGFAQVPGVYRQVIGDMQVTALFDGVVFIPVQQIKQFDLTRSQQWLNAEHVPQTKDGVQTAVNAYLVRRGSDLILVDTGTANCFGPTVGQVLSNLRAAGVQPQDVNHVLLTHAHPDHMCGLLTADGQIAYPNATVWLAQGDVDYWLSTTAQAQAPQPLRPLFDMARRAVAPYQAAGHFKPFSAGDALPDGVERVVSPGHTPGHTSWRLKGPTQQQSLLVWGDVLHYHAVQFRHPDAAFEYDSDRRQATASRKRLLAQASARGEWVAGAHLPFPGIGHVGKAAAGQGSYRWIAAEFGPTAAPAQP